MERATDIVETKSRERQVFDFYVQSSRFEILIFMVLTLLAWGVFYFTDRWAISDIPLTDELIIRFLGFVFIVMVFYFMLNHAKTPFVWDLVITGCMCVLCLGWVLLLMQSKSNISPLYPFCAIAFIGGISVFVTRYIWVAVLGMVVVGLMTGCVMYEKFSDAYPSILTEFIILALPLFIFFLVLTWQNLKRVDDIFDFYINTRNQRKRLIRDNDKLREQASLDALTGLPNRKSFEVLHASLSSQKAPFGLLIIDIDYFKMINEGYGHGVGDGVIVKLGSSIDAILPDTATLFCLGGEEFVVLVQNTDVKNLSALANTLVSSVKSLCIPHKSRPDAIGLVTISVGGCMCDPEEPRGLKAHLETADHNIYDAKSQGRNTYVIR